MTRTHISFLTTSPVPPQRDHRELQQLTPHKLAQRLRVAGNIPGVRSLGSGKENTHPSLPHNTSFIRQRAAPHGDSPHRHPQSSPHSSGALRRTSTLPPRQPPRRRRRRRQNTPQQQQAKAMESLFSPERRVTFNVPADVESSSSTSASEGEQPGSPSVETSHAGDEDEEGEEEKKEAAVPVVAASVVVPPVPLIHSVQPASRSRAAEARALHTRVIMESRLFPSSALFTWEAVACFAMAMVSTTTPSQAHEISMAYSWHPHTHSCDPMLSPLTSICVCCAIILIRPSTRRHVVAWRL